MRLNCPNCEAQYEVPDDVIPPEGRDVQCAACGNTWFQPDPRASDAGAEDMPDAAEDAEEAVPDTRAGRRELDPDVASVLREEAAREQRVRAAPRSGPDVQVAGVAPPAPTDRPAPPVAPPSDAPKADAPPHRARPAPPTPRTSGSATRQGLFPDIEEINSSLAPKGTARGRNDRPAVFGRLGGLWGGFLVAVLVALAALLIYVFAARLGAAIPGMQGALEGYVVWIDGMRGWLNGLVAPSVPS